MLQCRAQSIVLLSVAEKAMVQLFRVQYMQYDRVLYLEVVAKCMEGGRGQGRIFL